MRRDIKGIRLRRLAQVFGVAAGAVVIVLAAVFLWSNPYRDPAGATGPWFVMGWLAFWGFVAAIASITRNPGALLVCFLLSFFVPWGVGLYLLGTPGVFKWIPVAQLGYLLAAVALFVSNTKGGVEEPAKKR